jgi:small subunit ribosomal protein S20
MPNIKSKKKSLLRQRADRARNVTVRSALKTLRKKAVTAAAERRPDVPARLTEAQKRIDKACKQGVIHKNAAARKKSRLFRAARAASGSSKA